MTDAQAAMEDELIALRAGSGGFTMLALDQRESLRRMFPLVDGREADDEALRSFKRTATRLLSPYASAVLLDRQYAVQHSRPPELDPGTALILAADVLDQPPGGAVESTDLDRAVTTDLIAEVGAVAIKLLVIWRDDGRRAQRGELIAEFLDVAAEAGVASLVEGIVRPPEGGDWESPAQRHAAIVEAAQELSTTGTSIYKAEVPGYLPGDLSRVAEQSRLISAVVPVPWVVLSNGIEQDDFPAAVRLCCSGGAQGFLAGRAVWSDTVADADPAHALRTRSVERLRTLTGIVADANV